MNAAVYQTDVRKVTQNISCVELTEPPTPPRLITQARPCLPPGPVYEALNLISC
ncbi:hypothetical protein BDW59DRAFT_138782 [Aspergillus cavernicola]|uniref:Uncharacterized protein n=1 Tax=Aspergillus cavernicola TaxID=176166 RepID=A0ABR4IYL1_9EURO